MVAWTAFLAMVCSEGAFPGKHIHVGYLFNKKEQKYQKYVIDKQSENDLLNGLG